MTKTTASTMADGAYVSAVGTIDIKNGVAILRAQQWGCWESGRRGVAPATRMSATDVAQYEWYPVADD